VLDNFWEEEEEEDLSAFTDTIEGPREVSTLMKYTVVNTLLVNTLVNTL
jgi:hypothetical protein